MSRRACVYRFYDAEGELLYVGETGNLPRRVVQHGANAPWFGQVSRIMVDWHPSKAAALAAEAEAILRLQPKVNVARRRQDGSTWLDNEGRRMLARWMEGRGCSVGDFARLTGFRKQYVRRLLERPRYPNPEKARIIAVVTGGSVPRWAWATSPHVRDALMTSGPEAELAAVSPLPSDRIAP